MQYFSDGNIPQFNVQICLSIPLIGRSWIYVRPSTQSSDPGASCVSILDEERLLWKALLAYLFTKRVYVERQYAKLIRLVLCELKLLRAAVALCTVCAQASGIKRRPKEWMQGGTDRARPPLCVFPSLATKDRNVCGRLAAGSRQAPDTCKRGPVRASTVRATERCQ